MVMDIREWNIRVIQSQRKSISLEIRPEGLLVRAPSKMTKREIQAFILEKRQWIEKHMERMLERQQVLSQAKPYTVEEIEALADKALKVIPQKVRHYAAIMGVDYGRITIRNQKTRWGSCSSKGNLNFNCMLMLFPDEVIDSVVVHELCHRKHMNHSPQFYTEIEKVFPEYKRCRKWLKDNGSIYLSRMP